MKTFFGCLAVIVIALLIAAAITAVTALSGYNRLVRLQQDVDAQWAQVQNVYQRRADLIPNLVNTVSGAAHFEKSTLTAVTEARASVGKTTIDPNSAPTNPAQMQQFENTQQALSGALSRLLVVVERYPDLKANANFQGLQSQLEGAENRIAVERGRFNESARAYNSALRVFPMVFLAPMMGFQPKAYFTAAEGSEKAPNVNFDFNAPGASPKTPATKPATDPAPTPAQ